jgi:hypothetical protein
MLVTATASIRSGGMDMVARCGPSHAPGRLPACSGFALKQEPYDQAVRDVFSVLDRCEDTLSRQRYVGQGQPLEGKVHAPVRPLVEDAAITAS